jgi:hypothetical protein
VPAESRKLQGGARLSPGLIPSLNQISINSSDARGWGECTVTLLGKLQRTLRVRPGRNLAKMNSFVQTPDAPDVPRDHVLVICPEGRAEFEIQH